ncbi:MAG: AAA family ATPase [Betaproteobacteria bacterium]|nr:AAA family ATPase [Betaproteobacteria bacterium]
MNNDFFYGGANRGATLDALVYVLTHGEEAEGIITVTGECGSGKTTLCRMMMKRVPAQSQTVYLPQPAATPEGFLSSIIQQLKSGPAGPVDRLVEGDGGGNDISANRAALASELQNLLDKKYSAGGRVILLIDEAQVLTAEILDELRALYELELPRHKLFQVVLFGQNQLTRTLALSRLYKLKGYIAHHFDLKPLSREAVSEYLAARMRAAGHRGPGIFTPEAIKLIGMTSGGLIGPLNILADKSLQIAASANMADIDAHHVDAALKDTGIEPHRFSWRNWADWSGFGHRAAGVSGGLTVAVLGLLGWLALRSPSTEISSVTASAPPEAALLAQAPIAAPIPVPIPAPTQTYPPAAPVMAASAPPPASSAVSSSGASGVSSGIDAGIKVPQDDQTAAAGQPGIGKVVIAGVKLDGYKLLEKRVEETMKTMSTVNKNQYTIQLFSTDSVQPDRMQRFLIRAEKLIDLSDLYVYPVNNEGKARFRVTYGIYSSRDEADAAMTGLPEKYQSSFHLEPVTFGDLR